MSKLIVFEGNDRVGKTTLSLQLAKRLSSVSVKVFSSPGKEREGSLGQFVYALQDGQISIIDEKIPSISLQLLHVASHICNFENAIIPWLNNGDIAILDRWWWSTIAYGTASGIDKKILFSIIQPEITLIESTIESAVIIYLTRDFDSGHSKEYDRLLLSEYDELVEKSKYPVIRVKNNGQETDIVIDEIIQKL